MSIKKEIIFYLAIFLIILTFSMVTDSFDYDLWARLIAGMGFVETGHVLKADFLSYTPVHTWWDHEWGAGTIFYLCLKYFGGYSLIILQALLIFGIFFTASRIVKMRYNGSHCNIIFYFFSLMAIFCTLNNPVRSHLFSFLFFTVFIYIFEKVKRGNNKLLFAVPVIILFWNNIHGGVVSGMGLMLMYALGEFLNKKPFAKYLITFAVSCPVMLINPWGWDYIKFLLMANTMKRPTIVEWMNIFSPYQMGRHIRFKVFMIAVVIAELISFIKKVKIPDWYKNLDKTKYIIIFTTLYLSIAHVKMIPFFVIASICFIYEDFYALVQNIKLPQWKDNAIYGVVFVLSFLTFFTKEFSLPVGFNRYPVKEVEFIKQNKLTGKIFASFNYGSYVSYKLYPYNLIYMDGRYEEVYYDYMLPLQTKFYLVLPDWNRVMEIFPADIIILDKEREVYPVILKSKDWKLVYEGELSSVFVPADKVKDKYIMPTDDMDYYKNHLFDTFIRFK
ncbi:hypothetical protein J6P92_04435 [bacterium]|nr:hypothetical protein [bacterium]